MGGGSTQTVYQDRHTATLPRRKVVSKGTASSASAVSLHTERQCGVCLTLYHFTLRGNVVFV